MKKLCALFLFLSLTSVAIAQPMMMDPSKMSGIPRPDPQVPPQTITVRLIRGALTNRMPNIEVSLAAPDGNAVTAKTDAEGRATFANLEGQGPFVASAKEGDTKLESQPIQLEPNMGTRVMLVFPNSGAGAPDGIGHLDKTLPVGTIIVRAEDDAGQALQGLEVIVGHARAGEQKVEELHGKTDVAGEARFDGLPRKTTDGYLAEIVANNARFAGKPFKLEEAGGARVVLTVREVSSDQSKLTLGEGSHMLVEITDDSLQIIEVWRLHNAGDKAFDAGRDGLHIPLPRDALSAQSPDGNPAFTVVGHDAVFHGPVPPGDTMLRVEFVLAYHGSEATIEQPTPLPFDRVAMVTQDLPGLSVTGQDVRGEKREMQGKNLLLFLGGHTDRNGSLRLVMTGLPHGNPWPRYGAAALAVLTVLVFAIYAAMGGGNRRTRLEAERRELFVTLEDLDKKMADSSTPALEKEREKLVARLSDIYRGLDELGVARSAPRRRKADERSRR